MNLFNRLSRWIPRRPGREWPTVVPAPPTTMPGHGEPRCTACRAPLTFGMIHYCGYGTDLRPDRMVA